MRGADQRQRRLKTAAILVAAAGAAIPAFSVSVLADATFSIVNRPDIRANDNAGLLADTFGFATGVRVYVGGVAIASASVDMPGAQVKIFTNCIDVTFPPGTIVEPVAPGNAPAPGNTNKLALTITTNSPNPTISRVVWTAPVVNVIPRNLSGETNHDAQPAIAMQPSAGAQRDLIVREGAISTFSRYDGNSGSPWTAATNQTAPIFATGDGGFTWQVRPTPAGAGTGGVPRPAGTIAGPSEKVLAYSVASDRLYGVFSASTGDTPPASKAYVLSAENAAATFTEAEAGNTIATNTPNNLLESPWIATARIFPTDELYVAYNDLSYISNNPGDGRTALIDVRKSFTNPGPIRIDSGGQNIGGRDGRVRGQDGPVRVAAHYEVVYGAFIRYTAADTGDSRQGDVVVVRDDNLGNQAKNNPNPFQALTAHGTIVHNAANPPIPLPGSTAALANQRIRSDLSMAIDPTDPLAKHLYVAFTRMNSQPEVEVYESTNSGANFTKILTLVNAALPSLAVTRNGDWALMNLALNDDSTRFRQQLWVNNSAPPTYLANWAIPGGAPTNIIGDFETIQGSGNNFQGAFTAFNRVNPDNATGNDANFLQGVVYQRNANIPQGNLRNEAGNANVAASNDPFSFTIGVSNERTWTSIAATGNWSNGANWLSGNVAASNTDVAVFTTATVGTAGGGIVRTITNDAARTVQAIIFRNCQDTIDGNSVLNLQRDKAWSWSYIDCTGFGTPEIKCPLNLKSNTNTWVYHNRLTISGNITSDNNNIVLNKGDEGQLVLNAANDFAGTARVSGGEIKLGNAMALQNATVDLRLVEGGINFNGHANVTFGALSGWAILNFGATNLTVGSNNASTIYERQIYGSGNFEKKGTGEMKVKRLRSKNHNITNGKLALIAGDREGLCVAESLTINALASFDIADGNMILQPTGAPPLATVRQYLINGRNGTDFFGGDWTGVSGICSSAAAPGGIGDGTNPGDGISFAVGYVENSFLPQLGLPSYSMFGGETVDAASVLIRFTRGADCNLDGKVNTDDVTIVGALFASTSAGEWFLGDFDYDGFIDSDDVTVLGALYDPTAAPLSSAQLTAQYGSEFAAALARGQAMAAVPEPAGLSLLAIGALATRRRRRRIRANALIHRNS